MKYASLEMKQGKTSWADAHGLQVSHRVRAGAHPGVQAEQVTLAPTDTFSWLNTQMLSQFYLASKKLLCLP